MSKRPELLITNGPMSGKRFAVRDGGLRLGRSSSNDVHLPDEGLSRNHCLFETVGESGIRLTDLASANGTYLNGKALGGDPEELKAGDLIEVGETVLKVVGDEPEPSAAAVPGNVDLGLGARAGEKDVAARRSPKANLLWAVAVVAVLVAIAALLFMPKAETKPGVAAVSEDEPVLREAHYEKVEANAEGIFRYEMTLSADRVLQVSIADVPKSDCNVPPKSKVLDDAAMKELGDILAFRAIKDLDREYAGEEPDPPALTSWTLRLVYSNRARSVRVINTQEPEAFRTIREKLEAFSKNELGLWAIQYSREKLISLAEEALSVARAKWEDRDVKYGNLFGAVASFREALSDLETVNPKPDCHAAAKEGLAAAEAELTRRYAEQRFLADRALNLSQWTEARKELQVLVEMIPDRGDDRNREASAKLVDVEKRMKGGK